MSPRLSGMLSLILLPLALVVFIFSTDTHHASEPVQASIEASAIAVQPRSVRPPKAMAPQAIATYVPPSAAMPVTQLVQDAWKRFDEATRARPDANDVESLPRHLFPVSAAVARVGMAMRKDPLAVPEGIEFFRGCATAASELFSVRALCLRNLKFWQEKTGLSDTGLPNVPEEVARVARRLPPAR